MAYLRLTTPRRQRGVTLLELLIVITLAVTTTAVMIASLGTFDRASANKDILQTSAALIEAAQGLRAGGDYTQVRARAGIPAERHVGTSGVSVDDVEMQLATDRLALNGALGVQIKYRTPERCMELAEQAAQRFGLVLVLGTEVGGLRNLAARGASVTSNPLLVSGASLDSLCRSGVPPRRVALYEH